MLLVGAAGFELGTTTRNGKGLMPFAKVCLASWQTAAAHSNPVSPIGRCRNPAGNNLAADRMGNSFLLDYPSATVEIHGTAAITPTPTKSAKRYGQIAFVTSSGDAPPIRQAMYRPMPMGGVM